jgi:actin-like ATPase involved in cell morphogenesis
MITERRRSHFRIGYQTDFKEQRAKKKIVKGRKKKRGTPRNIKVK